MMAKPLSEDLRVRVIAAVQAGATRRAAAERFGVSAASAVRWVDAFRATGQVTARSRGGDQRSGRIEAFRAVILAAVGAEKDITLAELAALLLREHGVRFAISTVWRFLSRHELTHKKSGSGQRTATARRGTPAADLVRRAA